MAVFAVVAVALFLLVIVGSLRVQPASVPGAHAFASCADDLKLKCRSFHCYLGGPPAIPFLTRRPKASAWQRTEGSNPPSPPKFTRKAHLFSAFYSARRVALLPTGGEMPPSPGLAHDLGVD